MNKLIKILLIIFFINSNSFCLTIDDIKEPKGLMGIISVGDKVENNEGINNSTKTVIENFSKTETKTNKNQEIIETTAQNQTQEDAQTFSSNYAELSLKKIADDISFELGEDEEKISADLAVLWQATTEKSETIKYTIYKLSNPDEDKPQDSMIKKIIKPIASFSSLAGASVSSNPYMATGALIGGGLLNAFMKDDKEINYQFSKISDADMVLLVRKIDSLQKKLIDLYVDYKTKKQVAKLEEENFKKREEIYKHSQNKSKEELIIADVNYRNAKIKAQKAQDEFLTSKAILENLVGTEAVEKIEE